MGDGYGILDWCWPEKKSVMNARNKLTGFKANAWKLLTRINWVIPALSYSLAAGIHYIHSTKGVFVKSAISKRTRLDSVVIVNKF